MNATQVVEITSVLDLLVCEPAEAAQEKKLPVIPAHANILDGFVDELGFYCEFVSREVRM